MLIRKTKTMIVLLGQHVEETYKNQIDWQTDTHLIKSLHNHEEYKHQTHRPNILI